MLSVGMVSLPLCDTKNMVPQTYILGLGRERLETGS